MRARTPKPVDRATMIEIFRRFHAAKPEPKGELEHTNAYTLLVAVALSAQSTDVGVNKATRSLFPIADTPQRMLDLGEEGLRQHIRTLNFFNTKAKNVIATARRLVEEFGGKVPNSVEVLETLPGVGRKTASVVVNIAFENPRIAVDTHIFRVTNRIPLAITQDAARHAGCARGAGPGRVPSPRPPLAHPARPLHLQGAHVPNAGAARSTICAAIRTRRFRRFYSVIPDGEADPGSQNGYSAGVPSLLWGGLEG